MTASIRPALALLVIAAGLALELAGLMLAPACGADTRGIALGGILLQGCAKHGGDR